MNKQSRRPADRQVGLICLRLGVITWQSTAGLELPAAKFSPSNPHLTCLPAGPAGLPAGPPSSPACFTSLRPMHHNLCDTLQVNQPAFRISAPTPAF